MQFPKPRFGDTFYILIALCLLISADIYFAIAKTLDPDLALQNVEPDLDPNGFALRLFLFLKHYSGNNCLKKVNFEKKKKNG